MSLLDKATRWDQSLSEVLRIAALPHPRAQMVVLDNLLVTGSCSIQTTIQALHASKGFDLVVMEYPIQAPQPYLSLGLSQTLEGRGGISASLPQSRGSSFAAFVKPVRPTLYRRNGILVGHTGREITPDDVANALNEE